MAKRIELSFPADLDLDLAEPSPYVYDTEAQDTAVVLDRSQARGNRESNAAKLEQLRMGQCTVADVVRIVGAAIGRGLYPARIAQECGETTKVFLELEHRQSKHCQPTETEAFDEVKPESIYDITDGGEVNTDMVRGPGTENRFHDLIYTKFNIDFTQAPSVIVGFNSLHTQGYLNTERYSNNSGLNVTPEQIHEHIFLVSSKLVWSYHSYSSAGFTWLAVPNYERPLLQVGTVCATGGNPLLRIVFKSPYNSPPRVIVWLNRIDCLSSTSRISLMASATDISTIGFKIDLTIYPTQYGGISWFAYPSDTLGISSGDLQPTQGTSGIVTFDKPFTKPPRRILVALNKLDSGNSTCRFKIIHEAVSRKGMAVRVEDLGGSAIRSVGVAYIAME